MRTKLIVSTIIVAIGILLITGAINTDVEAIAPTQIETCGGGSTADGQRLILTMNISTLNGDCVLISHDNVTLDCNGFTIGGSSKESTGVKVTADGVTVKNCIIRNFEKGIELENSSGSTITKNTLTSNFLGINLESTSYDNTITANISAENLDGIMIELSDFNKIERNTLIENNRDGIRINGSDNNIIRFNNATDNNLNGIRLFMGADSNTIKKNTSNNNGRDGISVCDESDSNILTLNTANNNGRDGISVCDDSNSNILTLNTANSNQRDGFVDLTSGGTGPAGTDNIYKRNKCSGNVADSNPWGLCS